MITCQRCQTENLDGSQYCDECGAALSALPAQGAWRQPGDEENGSARRPAAAQPSEPLALEARAHEPARGTTESPMVANESSLVADASPVVAKSQAVPRPSLVGQSGAHRKFEDSAARRASPPGAAHAKLVIHRGRSVGKEFPLSEEESHIGRWDADGGIFPDVDLDSDDPEAKVSRRHARITRRGGQYYIEDLGSTNGTFVNRGRRLLPGDRQPLRDGDEVIVGKTFLKFHVLG